MKKLVSFFLAIVIATTVLFAQTTSSGLSGVVLDQKGNPTVGATVVAIHTPSGTQYGAVVDAKGNYRLQNMRPGGPYTVKVKMLGYKGIEAKDINLILADNLVKDFTLAEDAMGIDAVSVVTEGTNSNMRSDRAGAVTNINAKDIAIMPSVSRSINDLTRLTPQANGTSIGGGNFRQNSITVDGAPFNNSFGIGQNMPANGSPISIDALDQISVNVTPYDVRQSGFLGAAINAVTRSGDNEFRGSVYTYLNNEKFRGNKVGDDTFERNKSKYNLYGIRFGGPIVKNKLFFFVNYERESSVEPGPARIAATPENPYTDGKNNVARPTAEQMNTMKDYLITKFGYNPGAYQGYSSESPGEKILARLDWNIHRNHKLSLRYSQTKAKQPRNASSSVSGLKSKPYGSDSRQDMTAIPFEYTRYYDETNYYSLSAELNSSFAGKYNNTLRFTYSHQNDPRSTDGSEFPFVDILEDGKPFTSFGTELFSFGNLRDVKGYKISDDFTWTSGVNNFTAGMSFESNETKNGFQRFGTGYYAYNSWDDFVAGGKPSVFAITYANTPGFKQAFPSFKSRQLSAYFQDEITINSYFKVMAGLRLDMPFYPDINDSYNKIVAETPINGVKYNTATLPKTAVMFSPRIGFNYDIMKDRSLVLRGGTGLFTGVIPFVWIVAQSGDAGVIQTTYTSDKKGGTLPNFHPSRLEILKELYPNGAPAAGTVLPGAVVVMDKKFKMPQVWKTSVALDAQLPWGIKGSAEFIINKDVNAAIFVNRGLKDPVKWDNGTADNRYIYTSDKYHNSTLNNVYSIENGKGGYYWSTTLKLEKSFKFGLNAMFAYTHSEAKNVADGTGDQVGSAWQNNVTVNGANSRELSYASYVIPNKIIAALSYRKEYAKSMATSIGIFYEGGSQGRFSYIYSSGIVNDNSYSSLIYIPKNPSEITFETYRPKDWDKDYTAEEQSKDFFAYIEQDDYLSKRKGKYAERNGAKYPWVSQFDLKITQDFFVKTKGKRNTIQVGLDIMNVGNLLNKDWGNTYYEFQYGTNKILQQTKSSEVGVAPKYKMQLDGVNVKKETFNKYIGYGSTYSMQLSFRYIFN